LRNNGTSNVNLKLSWNNNACTLADSASLIVSNWNGSSWKNLGNGGITGNKNTGTIINSSSVVTYSYFVLANNACVLKANPGSPFTMCPGDTDLLGGTSTAVHGTSPFVYTWSPSARLKDTTSANPRIGSDSPSSTDTAFYTVYITDDKGCTSTDSIQVIIASPILLNITGNSDTSMFSSNHYGRIDIGITQGDGPVSYLWQYDNHTDSFAANLANGVYPVTLTDTHSCSINQDIAVGDTMQDIEFVENKGQIFDTDGDSVPDILYQSLSVGAKIYLTKNRISYVYSTNMAYADTIPDSLRIDSLYRTDLAFIGSNDTVVVTADYVTEGIRNYYINRDSVTYVHGYRQLTYNNLYSNIDLVITNKGSILYKFIVKDGGNPQDIRFKFFGVDSVYVDSLGNIVARNHLSDINIQSPSAKKDISGTIVSIGSSFVLSNDTFSIATDAVEAMSIAIHHIRPPLVPCAVVQDWTTRYGEIQDQAWDIKMDAQHNKYITGFTSSPNFPTFAVNLPSFGIGTLAFLLKFDANDHPIFATLLGGLANGQFVEGLALDVSTLGANHIFVTGVTDSPDLPLVNPGGGALQRGFITGPSPYIAEYKQTGQLIWFTYCGGSSGNQSGRTLTLDEHSGSTVIYIGGLIDFQTTGFSLANTCSGAYYHSSYSSTYSNSFILEFNSSREISYWTLVAPSADDGSYILHNLKVDSQGNLIVFGETNCAASSFDVVETPPEYTQGHTAGDYDYFIMKLDPCHVILWSSYFGGSGHDGFYPQMASSNCLAIDNADNFYITGETQSYDFPVYNSSSTYAFGRTDVDGFVAKFSSSNHQIWTRYFGGIGYDDSPAAITYNNERNEIFIAGITFSPSYFSPSHFPHAIFGVHPYGGFDQSSLNGNLDGFFAMFDGTSYALKWSTFIGGYWDDAITGLSSSDNELAFSGYSKSIDVVSFSSFPLRHKGNGAYWYNTFHTGENENAIVGAFQICNSPLCMAIDRPAFPDADNVKQSPAQYVNIFPNPSTGIVTIAFADNNEDKGMVEVFNIFGQRIVEMKSLQNNTQLNLSSYPKGLYLIKVTTAKGAITRKVVLE
jgi:hypothetical protein